MIRKPELYFGHYCSKRAAWKTYLF